MATTYNNLYLDTRTRLKKAGIEGGQLEARELICAAAGKTAEELYRDISLYTTDEIARMLHSQPATVRTWLSRARARVKDLLTRESERTGAHAALPSVVPDPRTHRDQRKEVPHD